MVGGENTEATQSGHRREDGEEGTKRVCGLEVLGSGEEVVGLGDSSVVRDGKGVPCGGSVCELEEDASWAVRDARVGCFSPHL